MLRAFIALVFILAALPAFAGNVSFSNGKGMWQSTLCTRPVPPAFVGVGPDAPAATMNAAGASYNLFVKQTQDYVNCLSAEAKADNESSGALIMETVKKQMRDAQADMARVRGQLYGPQR